MRYQKETMLFWIFGLLNFHGRWITFCRGEKFSGTVFEDKESKECFNPQLNKPRINFAVPSDKIKKNFVEKNVRVPHFLKPGVIHSLLDSRWNKTNNQNHLHTLLNFENERERKKWKLNRNNKIFYLPTCIFYWKLLTNSAVDVYESFDWRKFVKVSDGISKYFENNYNFKLFLCSTDAIPLQYYAIPPQYWIASTVLMLSPHSTDALPLHVLMLSLCSTE